MQSSLKRCHRSALAIYGRAFFVLSMGLFAATPLPATEGSLDLITQLTDSNALLLVVVLFLFVTLALTHYHNREPLPPPAARGSDEPTDDRLAVLFHSVPVAIMVVRLSDGHIVEVNSAFSDLWGYTRQEACGRTSLDLNLWIEPAQLIQQLKANRHADAQEFQVRCKSGEARDALVSVALVHFENAGHLLITAADVTDRRQAREMSHIAHHDTLTSLPNRLWLVNELRDLQKRETHGVRALLFIDLDRFKAVNDTFGHPAGDEVLCLAAQRMKSRLRTTDTLVRLGGDEFVALLEGLASSEDAEHIASNIVQIISMPFRLPGGKEARIGASVGISLVTSEAADVNTLICRADTALYAAKAAGRNTVRMFDESLTEDRDSHHG